jgi:hypothetical protein
VNWKNELHNAVEAVIASPKLTAGVSAATTSLGLASAADYISGAMSFMAILAGIIATMLLGRVHFAKYKNEVVHNKILRRQLIALGGDPDKDD